MISYEYAKALYDLGLENELVETFKSEYESLLKLIKNDETKAFFNSKNIENSVKKSLIKKIEFSQFFTNFLCLLLDKNRFNILTDIYEDYLKIDEEKHQLIKFTIYSNERLPEERFNKLKQILSNKYSNYKVDIKNIVDNSLLGGIKIYKDDEILDLSVIGQLSDLKNILESLL